MDQSFTELDRLQAEIDGVAQAQSQQQSELHQLQQQLVQARIARSTCMRAWGNVFFQAERMSSLANAAEAMAMRLHQANARANGKHQTSGEHQHDDWQTGDDEGANQTAKVIAFAQSVREMSWPSSTPLAPQSGSSSPSQRQRLVQLRGKVDELHKLGVPLEREIANLQAEIRGLEEQVSDLSALYASLSTSC